MARQYQPKRFFRNAPNRFLKQYFTARNAIGTIDFDTLPETQVDSLYAAWLELPESERNSMERHFQEIDAMASEGGSKAILDEARWHGEDLASQFASLSGFLEHSFWAFLERPQFWPGATAFHHADSVPSSYWRKRKNLVRVDAKVDEETIRRFERGISDYFHTMQGRGKNCKVDCYRRDDLDYFFAYPEDYARASVEWVERSFQRRAHHPAFEIIFVFSKTDRTLDIYLAGDRKPIPDLQGLFSEVILGSELSSDEKDERVYDLNLVRTPDFQFTFGPETGIMGVVVRKIRLSFPGKERIVLEADPTFNRQAVFDLMNRIGPMLPMGDARITQVGITVTFAASPASKKPTTRTFDLSWPNSCSLKHEGRDLIIRRMLADSGVEPREPVQAELVAA